MDPRAALRDLEGVKIGLYDLTIVPLPLLEAAMLQDSRDTVVINITGQPVTHTVSRAFVERVVSVRRSLMRSVEHA